MKFLFLICMLSFGFCFAAEGDLTIGGEAKVKWKNTSTLGELEPELNLNLQYIKDDAWCDAILKISLQDGGKADSYAYPSIERALVGYSFSLPDDSTLFLEVGHAKLDHLFNSKLQYKSPFNGLHAGYNIGNVSLHGGISNIPFTLEHYLFVGEISYTMESLPMQWTYSLTKWNPEYDYAISQVAARWDLCSIKNKPIAVYAAYLKNHQHEKDANGYYMGFTCDQSKQVNDFSIDFCYQYTAEDCVPVFDEVQDSHRFIVKGVYHFTNNLALQAKLTFAEENTTDISAIFTW